MPYQEYGALWKREFNETIDDLEVGVNSPQQAAGGLRYMVRSNLLQLDDSPAKLFLAHRLLARQVSQVGSGFWARFSLHYNLFAGSVLALGSPPQIRDFLLRNAYQPSVGCFALTEQHARVVIETTAELSPDERSFVLHTPHDTAAKTWIAQGLVADEAIVMATMVVHGHSYGPQAFLIQLRDNQGQLLPGITMLDMGSKGTDSDMDYARITFDRLRIPLAAHLCRYLQVKKGTVRHPMGCQIRIMELIGQRVFTARVLVAQAALSYARCRLERAANKMDATRMCWTPHHHTTNGKGRPVSQGFILRAFKTLDNLDHFCAQLEAELCNCQQHNGVATPRLQEAIAVAKVEAVETSIDICSALPEEPSYHKGRDFLQCCKSHEGESHVLMQKMARDLARTNAEGSDWQVKAALTELKQEMMQVQMDTRCKTVEAWETCGELVYAVAERHMDNVLRSYGCLQQAEEE